MTDEQIASLEAAAKAATPGPWRLLPAEDGVPYLRIRGTRIGARYKIANVLGEAAMYFSEECAANGRYIALANPTTVLSLIERVRELEERCDELGADKNSWFRMCEIHCNRLTEQESELVELREYKRKCEEQTPAGFVGRDYSFTGAYIDTAYNKKGDPVYLEKGAELYTHPIPAPVSVPEITEEMVDAFWSKAEVTRVGSIIGLRAAIKAAMLAAATPQKESES